MVSVVLIVGAYLLARDVSAPPVVQASSEAELLKAVAVRDTDKDGLADWEEVLYGTDPNRADTRELGMTDKEAVAKGLVVPQAPDLEVEASPAGEMAFNSTLPVPGRGTLTRALSESFMREYLAAVAKTDDGVLTNEEMKGITDTVLSELDASVVHTPNFKNKNDLKVQGSGAEAMRAFAVAAEKVYLAHTMEAADTELVLLKKALETDDTAALKQIGETARLYHDTAIGLSVLPVPAELAEQHLRMVNALMRLSESTLDFTRANSDPVVTMLALKQYPAALKELAQSFADINQTYARAGLVLNPQESGVAYVRLIERVVEDQKTLKGDSAQKP